MSIRERTKEFLRWAREHREQIAALASVVMPGDDEPDDDLEVSDTQAEAVSRERLQAMAVELRGEPMDLPRTFNGQIAEPQARGQVDAEARFLAFALLWLGIVPDVETAEADAMKAILGWYGLEELPW